MQEILLVEDSDEDAQLLRLALKRAGIANPVRHLFDGLTAGILLREIDRVGPVSPLLPGVLLIDLKLPGMSGFDLLELTQKSNAFAGTLRIVLSQLDDTQSIKRAYALGARSFLTKPVSSYDLIELTTAFPEYWKFGGNPAHARFHASAS